jgi:hypothetical protein
VGPYVVDRAQSAGPQKKVVDLVLQHIKSSDLEDARAATMQKNTPATQADVLVLGAGMQILSQTSSTERREPNITKGSMESNLPGLISKSTRLTN